jgi:hypothetical protein
MKARAKESMNDHVTGKGNAAIKPAQVGVRVDKL